MAQYVRQWERMRDPSRLEPRRYARDMSRREEILVKHREAIRSAASRHKASSIALVGSVARGDDTDASDYDFLTDFLPGATLFDMAGLKVELEDLLGGDVDVVDADGLDEKSHGMRQEAITL